MNIKKLFTAIAIFLCAGVACGCIGNETNNNTDTSDMPAATDTMPVLRPGNVDTTGVIETPPTNDDNAIMPDSAIKSK